MKNDRVLRIIPRLDIKGAHLVKGIHLEGLRVLGYPEDYADIYGTNADELILQDVVASLFDRNSIQNIITKVAMKSFIPLTVGGGLRTLTDIRNVLKYGADRVSLNTQAIKSPQFVKEAALEFGRSTIVVAIEAVKDKDGKYYCFTDNGRQYTGLNVLDWASQVEHLGAGEILLTNVDREGRGEGFDVELIKQVCGLVNIPVIAHGGAGCINDIVELAKTTDVAGIVMASLLHYEVVKDYKFDFIREKEGNFEFLKGSDRSFKKITPTTIKLIKDRLIKENITVRN